MKAIVITNEELDSIITSALDAKGSDVKDLSDNMDDLDWAFEDVKWCVEWAIDALEDWQYEFGEGETTDE